MTVEIRELIIRASVVDESGGPKDEESKVNKAAVADAVEQTLDILEKRKER